MQSMLQTLASRGQHESHLLGLILWIGMGMRASMHRYRADGSIKVATMEGFGWTTPERHDLPKD